MSRMQKRKSALRDAINEAIERANRRSTGEFDGLRGRLPDGASIVLADIIAYLRQYLFDERGFTESRLRKLLTEVLPPIHKGGQGFRSVSQDSEDSGLTVALGVLNSIASVLRVKDKQISRRNKDGPKTRELLTRDEAIWWLLSGDDGLGGRRYVQRQREFARRGGQARSDARQRSEDQWHEEARLLRQKHPQWTNSELARHIARNRDKSQNTVRQALPRLGLSRKPDK
jgi:hypothetical protein